MQGNPRMPSDEDPDEGRRELKNEIGNIEVNNDIIPIHHFLPFSSGG